jgi:hypothetical protein
MAKRELKELLGEYPRIGDKVYTVETPIGRSADSPDMAEYRKYDLAWSPRLNDHDKYKYLEALAFDLLFNHGGDASAVDYAYYLLSDVIERRAAFGMSPHYIWELRGVRNEIKLKLPHKYIRVAHNVAVYKISRICKKKTRMSKKAIAAASAEFVRVPFEKEEDKDWGNPGGW